MLKKIKNLTYKFLIKTQKITDTDNLYVAKQGSYLTIGNIITAVASFLLAVAFGRLLPKEIYGNYRYIISIVMVIGIFALPAMDDAVLQAVANRFDGSFRRGLKEKFNWALLGSIACIVVGGYFFFFKDNSTLAISFLIAAVFFPIMQSTGLYLSYLGGKKLFKVQVKYNVLTQIISSLLIIVALFFTKNLIILILMYFSSYALLGTIFLMASLKRFPPNRENDEKFISFGKKMSALYVITTFASQLDKILLFNLLGSAELAIYSFAMLPVSEASIFLKNIRLLALPKFSVRSKEEIKKTLLKKVYKATLLMIPLIALYIALAPFFYRILFPQYMDAVNYSMLLFSTLIVFPFTIIPLYFQAQLMKKELYQYNIISPIVTIVLLLVLTPVFGIAGTILARFVGQIFASIMSIFIFKKG